MRILLVLVLLWYFHDHSVVDSSDNPRLVEKALEEVLDALEYIKREEKKDDIDSGNVPSENRRLCKVR